MAFSDIGYLVCLTFLIYYSSKVGGFGYEENQDSIFKAVIPTGNVFKGAGKCFLIVFELKIKKSCAKLKTYNLFYIIGVSDFIVIFMTYHRLKALSQIEKTILKPEMSFGVTICINLIFSCLLIRLLFNLSTYNYMYRGMIKF